MGLDAYLNQTCTITRRVTTGLDRYNNSARTETTIASDVRCRKVERLMRMMDKRTSEYAHVRVNLVLLPAGYTLQPDDVIRIGEVSWEVKIVLNRQRANASSHVSCQVEAINA